jgi:hypothetical protein
MMLCLAGTAGAGAAAIAAPPVVSLDRDATNLPPTAAPDGLGVQWPPPAPLSNILKRLGPTRTVEACESACVAYENPDASLVSGWTRCQSFTLVNGTCFGRVDSTWEPRPDASATSGRVTWPPRPCTSVRDCSHNGVCDSSMCQCHPGWRDDRCSRLDILPADRSSGLRAVDDGANTSTWGGAVTQADDGSYHMLASEMMEHCGIGSWTSNSHVVHAVSSTPGGTYTRLPPSEREVFPVFSHEPNWARAPSGEYVVVFTANDPSNHSMKPGCHCTNGSTVAECGRMPWGAGPTWLSWSPPSKHGGRPEGPWSTPMRLFESEQHMIDADTNLAIVILPNSSVVGLGRTGYPAGIAIHLVTAAHWKDPSSYTGRWNVSLFDLVTVPNAGLEGAYSCTARCHAV